MSPKLRGSSDAASRLWLNGELCFQEVNFHLAGVLGVCSIEISGNISSDFSVDPKSLASSLYVGKANSLPLCCFLIS